MTKTLVNRTIRVMSRHESRRNFLRKFALVGSALVTAPLDFPLKPVSAYAAVCGPGAECNQGWSVFCCTVNRGVNKCPPGTFVGGWWRASGSSYCCDSGGGAGSRYYIDCHPECECTSGCGPFCTSSCLACKCRCNNVSSTCDRRRICCNVFRYGQCHTEIGCSGGVACRVVTCTPPYVLFDSCGSSLRTDNATAQHTAPCLSGPCT
jgi:hypothetical protein